MIALNASCVASEKGAGMPGENDMAEEICKKATALERERCVAIVEAELREQRAVHLRSPEHVKVYPRWEGRIDGLEQALKALRP